MAVREVVQAGADILRVHCRQVKEYGDGALGALLEDMRDTVRAEYGAGLAAPQIGVDMRVVVIDVDDEYYEMINPIITKAEGSQTGPEGCLSVKGREGTVTRPKKVKVLFRDRNGKKHILTAEDFLARAICHEVDHLDGKMYTDIASEVHDIGTDSAEGPDGDAEKSAGTDGI